MAKPLYTWEVTEKKQDAVTGEIKEFQAKRTGSKPPKGATNIKPLGDKKTPAAPKRNPKNDQ